MGPWSRSPTLSSIVSSGGDIPWFLQDKKLARLTRAKKYWPKATVAEQPSRHSFLSPELVGEPTWHLFLLLEDQTAWLWLGSSLPTASHVGCAIRSGCSGGDSFGVRPDSSDTSCFDEVAAGWIMTPSLWLPGKLGKINKQTKKSHCSLKCPPDVTKYSWTFPLCYRLGYQYWLGFSNVCLEPEYNW